MREIKFRTPVMCQNGHKGMWYWHIGNFGIGEVKHDGVTSNRCDCPKQALGEGYIKDGDDQQFTGLLDKHGKEIYEGDIVKACGESGDDTIPYEVEYCGDRDYPAFDLKGFPSVDSNAMSYCLAVGSLEAIGNIYSNPELLSKEK